MRETFVVICAARIHVDLENWFLTASGHGVSSADKCGPAA